MPPNLVNMTAMIRDFSAYEVFAQHRYCVLLRSSQSQTAPTNSVEPVLNQLLGPGVPPPSAWSQRRNWSGREDSNLRPPGPEPGALARLSHAPCFTSLATTYSVTGIIRLASIPP